MTAVNIKGTFKKDTRPDNGLETIADALVKDELAQYTVIGVIELHRFVKDRGEAPRPIVHFVSIEVVEGDVAADSRKHLNDRRKARGLHAVSNTLFDDAGGDQDEPDGEKAHEPVVADTDRGRSRGRRGAAGGRADGAGEPDA